MSADLCVSTVAKQSCLLGAFRKGQARSEQIGEIPLENFAVSNGATEFSIPVMNLYAVIDLQREK